MRQQLDLGYATLSPTEPVVAGSYTTITYTYTAGHPVDDSGLIKIAFRTVGDFGRPQFDDPAAPNYCTVRTTGHCRVVPRWDPRGNTRPWVLALYLRITGGYLDRGEQLIVTFGDTSEGSCGWRMQTYVEETWEFRTFVDPIATYRLKALPESPTVRIVPGEPVRAVCIAPSQVLVGDPFNYYLKLEDRWGNPVALPDELSHTGFDQPGVQRLWATDPATSLSAHSNPMWVLAQGVAQKPYWADFHGQTEETCGIGSLDEYFAFARDMARLDIAAHQGNDFEVSDALWETLNDLSDDYNETERFVVFPGYEWSGNTPLGGDRNVYFASRGGVVCHSCTDLLPDESTEQPITPTATGMFRYLREYGGPRAFAFAHVGGRYADLDMHDPEIELAVEIHSAWGTYEWLLADAIERGYRVGICANSDGHKCRPGASYPGATTFGSYGGLTCVLAAALDREQIVKALAARHFYATTGNRCILNVRLTTSGGRDAMMGDVIALDGEVASLHVKAHGTAPIECVEVRNGMDVVVRSRPFDGDGLGSRIKVVWSGSEVRGRARQCLWDGGLKVEDNTILGVQPINFWRPDRQPNWRERRVTWHSITTGGLTGVILSLAQADGGDLSIDTAQGQVRCAVADVGLEPLEWSFGGIDKRLMINRLPSVGAAWDHAVSVSLEGLHEGDNPIYVRVMQEDGHMAWSSPIYVTKGGA